MGRCIWCLQSSSSPAVEHIIPASLGCPENFVFADGTVCESCNNKLGHLDQAVINDFDMITFEHGIKRKRNRPPAINSRGNMTGYYENGEKVMTLNMGSDFITDIKGEKLAPYSGGERHINASISAQGSETKINYKTPFGYSKKFRRGIYKIALGSLAYFLGANAVLGSDFDNVRSFVKKGEGDRFIFFRPSPDVEFKNQAWPPYVNEDGYYSVAVRLTFVEILADLSPEQSLAPIIMAKSQELYGDTNWAYTPINT